MTVTGVSGCPGPPAPRPVEEELKIALGVVIPLFRPMVEMFAGGNLQSQHPVTHKNVTSPKGMSSILLSISIIQVHKMVPGGLG